MKKIQYTFITSSPCPISTNQFTNQIGLLYVLNLLKISSFRVASTLELQTDSTKQVG
ncbi:hypothetical protein IQ246_16290 [aff. Roholtiella sp. LEGE 12411]|nr:hypothetical protein [aff. Roholtiella sp. LEGE 12411]